MEIITNVYPLNVVYAIYKCQEQAQKAYIHRVYTEIAKLDERQQAVLRMRFKELKSLKACGEELGITRERVRQIQSKALRLLQHPFRAKFYMAVPRAELIEQDFKYRNLALDYEELKIAFERALNTKVDNETITEMAEQAKVLETPIEHLELSVRSYNCLKRAGKNSLKDLAKMREYDFRKIRNLGGKAFEEIKERLAEYGIEVGVDKP